MDARTARDEVQRVYNEGYPDTNVKVEVIEKDDRAALYGFYDGDSEGSVLCTVDVAEQYLAVLKSDIGDHCATEWFFEAFEHDAVMCGFEPFATRRVTWRRVLDFLREQPDEYLDRPALVWMWTQANEEVGEVDQLEDINVHGGRGIGMVVNAMDRGN